MRANFNIFGSDGRHMVWRKKNQELESKNLIPTVKHGDGGVLVWRCMSAAGVGNLHFIEGITSHVMYIDILKQNLRSSSFKMDMGNQIIFQQDNVPKHTARKAKEWLLYNTSKQLHSTLQSPDMNPIENLWIYFDVQIRKRQIKSKAQLKAALLEEWEKVSPQTTEKLVNSMTNRVQSVIGTKGYLIKYLKKPLLLC